MNKTAEFNKPVLLKCDKEGIKCRFIIQDEFKTGVVQSENYHFHSLYEIHIPIKGSVHILAEDTNIIAYPGEVCIIPPGITHYVFPDENSYRTGFRFSFVSDNNIFDKAYGGLKSVSIIENCDIYSRYILRAIENRKPNIPDFMTADLLFHAMYETALLLMPDYIPEAGQDKEYSDILVAEKTEYFLNKNYNKKIRLEDLAQFLNLGKRQTERVTSKFFGETFSPLLSKKRLAAAKFLLKTTDMSVDEISVLCGFDDKNYFYRKFSAAFGTTPGKYRNTGK